MLSMRLSSMDRVRILWDFYATYCALPTTSHCWQLEEHSCWLWCCGTGPAGQAWPQERRGLQLQRVACVYSCMGYGALVCALPECVAGLLLAGVAEDPCLVSRCTQA